MTVPDLVTFDCYGTLIDWRSGVLSSLRERIADARATPDDVIFAAFADIENVIEAGPYVSYRKVLNDTTRGIAERLEWRVTDRYETALADGLPSWRPFPEVNDALERLRTIGYRLGILSNVDDDLLAGTRRHLPEVFDFIVTAQQIRRYKPAPAHFQRALAAVHNDRGRLVHVAQSYYHDVQAAAPLGIRVVWVNRTQAELPAGGPAPTVQVSDLREAADWLEALRAE
jgi:2-haloalkanoic acid dehalogenase type II